MDAATTASVPRGDEPKDDADLARPAAGVRLGRYELVAPLAHGGMAEVWIARHLGELGFSRIVAAKILAPRLADDGAFRRMFLEEARIAARVRHTNVVEVLDLGETGSIVFQIMALVEGDSIAGLLKRTANRPDRRGLPASAVARILGDAARGLHAAHELVDEHGVAMGLVHRDVSPQNILVGADGVTKLSDFGIAKVLGRQTDETAAGQVRGKFAYLSPEQAHRKGLDRRSDVFSAGIVLWEALTGERLFRGVDELETLANVKSKAIPDPRSLAPDVPTPLARVALRALARDPAERFPTAALLADALDEAAKRSGAIASTTDVAALVEDLAGHDIARLQARIRGALRRDGGSGSETMDAAVVGPAEAASEESIATTVARTAAREVPRQRRGALRGAAIAGSIAALVATVTVWRSSSGTHQEGAPSSTPPGEAAMNGAAAAASAAPIDPPSSTPPIDSPSSATPAGIEPAPTVATSASVPSRAAPATGRPRAPRPAAPPAAAHKTEPAPETTLRPKFESPYER